jgi:hypothetical protein
MSFVKGGQSHTCNFGGSGAGIMHKSNRWWWCVQGWPRAMSWKWTREPCNSPSQGPTHSMDLSCKQTEETHSNTHVCIRACVSLVSCTRQGFVHLPRVSVNFIIINWIKNNSFFFFLSIHSNYHCFDPPGPDLLRDQTVTRTRFNQWFYF